MRKENNKRMKKGFTLVEMLVVIGIIAVLIGASVAAYGPVTRQAQRARGQELVTNMKDALEFVLQKEDSWPLAIRSAGSGVEGLMDERVAASLVKYGALTMDYVRTEGPDGEPILTLTGVGHYGILSPWAEAVVRQRIGGGGSVGDSTVIPSGGTVGDHRLRFAVDHDYDGRVEVSVSARGKKQNTTVRASACVWCCGYDGKFGTKDDIYSWGGAQEE